MGRMKKNSLLCCLTSKSKTYFWRATTCGVHTKERCGTWNPRTGYNARGKCEGTVWNTDDFSDVVAYLLAVCEEWDTIEEGLDKGYTLWVLVLIDDDNKALIDSKEDADKILEALQN